MKRILAVIFLIIFIFALYILLYLLPTVKAISRYKREIKDMKLVISDFVKMEKRFLFSNEREKNYFTQSQEELKNKIPEVKTREDFTKRFAEVSEYIQNLADRDGITKPVLTLISDSGSRSPISSILKGVKYQTISLRFTGPIKNVMNFINHIPWGSYYLSEDKILIAAGDNFPNYTVFLKIYYIDSSQEDEHSLTAESASGDSEGLVIDYNSAILLRPIHGGLVEKRPKKELSSQFGKNFGTGQL